MSQGKTLIEVFDEEAKTEAAKRRLARRAKIVETVRRVGKVSAAASELGISSAAVYAACNQSGVSVLDIARQYRSNRNKEIADYASEHGSAEACKHFNVAITTVRAACAEHGVRAAFPRVPMTGTTVKIVALILQGKGCSEIAREIGVTRQRVGQVRQECLRYMSITSSIVPAKNSDEKSC